MNKALKKLVERGFYSLGLHVTGNARNRLGLDPYRDMSRLCRRPERPVVIDVGANKGQTVRRAKSTFPNSIVHSFEPSEATFATLQQRTRRYRDVHLNNFALGDRAETKTLIENSRSTMTSFLSPSADCWGEVVGENNVSVRTLDDYAEEHGIGSIDILKTDTQGFDLEVIKGAKSLIERNRIHMIYTEIIFSDMYEHLPPFDEVLRFIMGCGFDLVSFYRFYHQNDRASWSDTLFVNPNYQPS